MARVCQVTGKKPSSGNSVSHSNRKTKRRWVPNLLKKKIIDPETGQIKRVKISASALRTLRKTK